MTAPAPFARALRSPLRRRPAGAPPLRPAEIHEKAFCESADVGAGVVVEAGAYVGAGAVLGERCRVRACACVEGVLGEGVEVGRGALIGAGVRVGDGAIVVAGSVVLAHVAPGEIVDGGPLHPIG